MFLVDLFEVEMSKQIPKRPMTYISLFSGAGIGCYGFQQEKFNCVATVEILEKRLKFQKYNNKCIFPSGYIQGDVREAKVQESIFGEVKRWRTSFEMADLDVLIATPPCQGMSVANHKKKDEKARNSLVVESIRLTKVLRPRFFILENVKSFLTTICTDVDGQDKSIQMAIELNLAGAYNIFWQVLNFKDYGSLSSRTRSLVIGVRKDLQEITPYDIFPDLQKEQSLKAAIGALPRLPEMGDIDSSDIYHHFRPYRAEMLEWIRDLKEGESAFGNTEKRKIPHRVVNGRVVYNQNKNGDKYRRCLWNKIGPCIHTRNDILASQSTIHPSDNRVFSVRELMRLMSIPDSFKLSDLPETLLNSLSRVEKRAFLAKEEMNIRHSIGEAVPTVIMRQMAVKIKTILGRKCPTDADVGKIIARENLWEHGKLAAYLKANATGYSYPVLTKIAELSNSQRQDHAAYYTRQDVCYSMVRDLPEAGSYKKLRILEPAIGAGNFLPLLVRRYQRVPAVVLDVVDIDEKAIAVLKILVRHLQVPDNFQINYIVADFLTHEFSGRYDIVIGNPPFKRISGGEKALLRYKSEAHNRETNNLFSFFIEKSLSLGDVVSLIVPKSLINAPEFNKTRELLARCQFQKISDYGEDGFRGVKIETISFILRTRRKFEPSKNFVKIESGITKEITLRAQAYLFDPDYPYWLLYRDKFFDNISAKMKFNIFTVFRDRQITKQITRPEGKIRVLKSRNIQSNSIADREGYDCFVDDANELAVRKYLNNREAVLVPNLTYKPRACFMPKDTITDGSVAILTLRNGSRKVTRSDLEYYGTEEFERFYALARNLGTRSLNIDRNSVFFFGLRKDG